MEGSYAEGLEIPRIRFHDKRLLLSIGILTLLWLRERSELTLTDWIGGFPPFLHHAGDCRRVLVSEYPHHLAFSYLLGEILQENVDLGRERQNHHLEHTA